MEETRSHGLQSDVVTYSAAISAREQGKHGSAYGGYCELGPDAVKRDGPASAAPAEQQRGDREFVLQATTP